MTVIEAIRDEVLNWRLRVLGIAGPNLGSELAQKLSLNKLANSYMAFNTNYHDIGLFGVYVTVRVLPHLLASISAFMKQFCLSSAAGTLSSQNKRKCRL